VILLKVLPEDLYALFGSDLLSRKSERIIYLYFLSDYSYERKTRSWEVKDRRVIESRAVLKLPLFYFYFNFRF